MLAEHDSSSAFRPERFDARIAAYEKALAEGVTSKSPAAPKRAMAQAIESMPEACDGCRTCHYLFNV